MNSTTTSWEKSTNFTNSPGSFLDIHEKCKSIFPKSFLGFKLDVVVLNDNPSRLTYYTYKNWKNFGGIFQYKFDETARFKLHTLPKRDGSRVSIARFQKRTPDASFDIGILPTLHLNCFHRIQNIRKLLDSPFFRDKISDDFKVDVGGRLAITPYSCFPFLGLRVSTTNYVAAVVFGINSMTSSLWCSSDGAEFGITVESLRGKSIATFGIKKEFPQIGFSNAFTCSTERVIRCQLEQKLPLNIPLKFVASYAYQIEHQKDAFGLGLVIE